MCVSVSLDIRLQINDSHDDDDGGDDADSLPAPSEREGPPSQVQREDC